MYTNSLFPIPKFVHTVLPAVGKEIYRLTTYLVQKVCACNVNKLTIQNRSKLIKNMLLVKKIKYFIFKSKIYDFQNI